MLAAVGPAAAPDGHHHAVKFYSGDDSLFTTVAEFLSDGLAVTDHHRGPDVEHYLSGIGVPGIGFEHGDDVPARRRQGPAPRNP